MKKQTISIHVFIARVTIYYSFSNPIIMFFLDIFLVNACIMRCVALIVVIMAAFVYNSYTWQKTWGLQAPCLEPSI